MSRPPPQLTLGTAAKRLGQQITEPFVHNQEPKPVPPIEITAPSEFLSAAVTLM